MSIWSRLFGKDPKELFLAFTPHQSSWRVVSWNTELKAPSERRWVVELQHGETSTIEWAKAEHENLNFWKGKELLRRRRIPDTDHEFKALMNLAIHSTLKYSLETNHEFMVTPVVGATALDIQNEARALQWIQASFGTLMRALDRIEKEPSLILTAAFFAGHEPESGERVLRLIALNLDIFFYLKPDSSLQIVIFDDKGSGHGSSQAPTFQQIIKVTKPQFYDEISKVVHRLALVGEVK